MPLPRPPPSATRGALLRPRAPAPRPARRAALSPSTRSQPQQKRLLHSSAPRRGGGGAHMDEPGGWLWGEAPGQAKKPREGWELPMYWMFCGSFAVFTVAYVFKPDTSIQTWALEEARRRLEKEGILEDPDEKQE